MLALVLKSQALELELETKSYWSGLKCVAISRFYDEKVVSHSKNETAYKTSIKVIKNPANEHCTRVLLEIEYFQE